MSLLEQLKKLQTYKKSKAFYAEKLGISVEEVDELLKELRKGESVNYLHVQDDEYIAPDYTTTWTTEDFSKKENLERGTLETTSVTNYEPKSVEELVELHKIDLNKYKVSSYWTKQRGDKFFSSLFCTLKKPTDFSPEEFANFLKGYKSDFKPGKPIGKNPFTEPIDVEISLADFHIDKLDLNGETILGRKSQYRAIVANLMLKVGGAFSIDKIVFTLGNDFFHTDTYNNTTTKGTPLEASTQWNDAYEEGFDLMVDTIAFLRQYCNTMEIILVNGNHDKTKSYYLAHALSLYFSKDENIHFNRDDSPFKYTMMGNTFVGYNHGDGKIDELPLIFATDRDTASSFGQAKYREIRTGDKHYYMVKEVKGVRIQQLPSLAGTDKWHRDHQYVNNIRAALALVYHPTTGKCGEFEERIEI